MDLLQRRGKIAVEWSEIETGEIINKILSGSFLYERKGELGYGRQILYLCHPQFDLAPSPDWLEVPTYRATAMTTTTPGAADSWYVVFERIPPIF